MFRPFRFAALALVCTCYTSAAGAVQKLADPDAKEIASYRLTIDGLKKMMNVNRLLVQQMMQDPKVKEAMKVEAELDALQKKDDPTEADQKRIEALEARKEELESTIDNPLGGGEARTLSEMEAQILKHGPMRQALQAQGMAPREYAKFWLAFIQASFAHGFQKSGMLKQLPADINAENVKFVADHEADIQAMTKEFEALAKQKQN